MTRQKNFKRRVRERMQRTGESYTAARRMLIAAGERPDEPVAVFDPPVSEERVVAATGKGWAAWFAELDAWGAAGRSHSEIARWLRDECAVDPWYSQSITVGYERARGLRAPGQRPDGWAVSASRTVSVPVHVLFGAWGDETIRARWLPGGGLRVRSATADKVAHYDWEDGATRVHVHFDAVGPERSRATVSHERLPDADTADEMKAWWRERLVALKALLEDAITSA